MTGAPMRDLAFKVLGLTLGLWNDQVLYDSTGISAYP